MNKISDLKDIATCNYCSCIFESPVVLPCLETICQKPVEDMKLIDDSREEIRCHLCNKLHQIPKDSFLKDRRLTKLIELDYHKIDFGESHMKATCLCKEL